MKILFPTDFSENAEIALEFALDICKKTNGHLIVFHAYDLPYSDRSLSTSLLEIMKRNATENMAKLKLSLDASGVRFETLISLGNPIRMTKEICAQKQVNLVVMGTKGSSGLEEVLIGSNAASIIQNLDIPVYVIPPNSTIKEVKTIVLASDLDFKQKDRPLVRLREFAKSLGSDVKIEILHVQTEGGINPDDKALIAETFKDIKHAYVIANDSNIEKAVLDYCEKENADVVSIITKRYSFFEKLFHQSLTSKLAYHSSIPLLALHEPK